MTKAEKALKYIDCFPEVPEKLNKQAYEKLTAYILFNHKGQARCTVCGKEHRIPGYDSYKHSTSRRRPPRCWNSADTRYTAKCPHCGREGITVDITKNFKGDKIEAEADVVLFIAGKDRNLYIRCFYQSLRFKHGELKPLYCRQEMQRYVYAPEVSARYGVDTFWAQGNDNWLVRVFDETSWIVRSKIDWPNFYSNGNAGIKIGLDAIKKTWLKYSMANQIDFGRSYTNIYKYLEFYRTHQGIERLIKCGMTKEALKMVVDRDKAKLVNWKETEVTKMLGVTKPILNLIRKNEFSFENISKAQKFFPNVSPYKAIDNYNKIGFIDHFNESLDIVKVEKTALAKYIIKQKASASIYKDYINACKNLKYDLKDKLIQFPPHLMAAHDRVISAVEAIKAEEKASKIDSKFEKNYKELQKKRKLLEYEDGDFVIIQPDNIKAIILEGKILSHCVGGYAEQHAKGQTNIMFLRHKNSPDIPFYTIEISNDYRIIQCHGYANEQEFRGGKPKPQEIKNLEKRYQEYLDKIKYTSKRPKRQKVKVTA